MNPMTLQPPRHLRDLTIHPYTFHRTKEEHLITYLAVVTSDTRDDDLLCAASSWQFSGLYKPLSCILPSIEPFP